jgi:MazG family protein
LVDYRDDDIAHGASCQLHRIGANLAGEKLPKLVSLTARLRGPEGCPWDREQDYDSLRGLVLEEAYEVIDAINSRDFEGVEEELGDLLFQVVFCSCLAEEEGRFNIDDVIEGVHEKLIRRHPHVFGDVRARNAEEALKSWLEAKGQERKRAAKAKGDRRSVLDGIAAALPATLEAHELGLRASEVGFDWKRTEDLLEKIEEELRELRSELNRPEGNSPSRIEEEAGDLLFAVANLTRFIHSDPEICLRRANQKFKRRFRALEEEMNRRGKVLRECSLDEMELLWNEIKSKEAG